MKTWLLKHKMLLYFFAIFGAILVITDMLSFCFKIFIKYLLMIEKYPYWGILPEVLLAVAELCLLLF